MDIYITSSSKTKKLSSEPYSGFLMALAVHYQPYATHSVCNEEPGPQGTPHTDFSVPLSYSTAMQKHLRWVLALAYTPKARFSVGNTNMLVSKNTKIWVTPHVNLKICVSPNAKPQRESVEYRRKFLALAMYISFFLCHFHSVGCRFSVEYGLKTI